MARSLNRVELIGNLGADPELRATNSGVRVAKLRVATSRSWNDRQGQPQERTEWHNVVCWDRLADICERYLKRGDRVYIEGSIEYRQSEGQDGQTRYWTDIRAREMIMLGGRGENADVGEPASARGRSGARPGAGSRPDDLDEEFGNDALSAEDDLPF